MIVEALKEKQTGVAIVEDLHSLDRIFEKQTDAVLWRRDVPEPVQHWFNSFAKDDWTDGRYILDVPNIIDCILLHFEESGVPRTDAVEWLIADVSMQAELISDLFSAAQLRMRIEIVSNDACRLFHADNVKARLVCTYAGPGTEYGIAEDGSIPEEIHRAPTGQPILLKGLKWTETENVSLKHRSPPIEGTEETRLVIVLEPVCPNADAMNSTYSPFL